MSTKTFNIIGWVLSVPLFLLFLYSGSNKISGHAEAVKGAEAIGLSLDKLRILGIVEIASVTLLILPRTGVLGTLLLTAYLGGAIATHLEHNSSINIPVIAETLLWISAVLRFPELSQRILKKQELK